MDRERLVGPERDRSPVAAELESVLADEPFHERARVDEVGPLLEPLEITQDVEAPAHPQHVAALFESGQRPFDPLGAVVQSRRELAHRGADRAGLPERDAQSPGRDRFGP